MLAESLLISLLGGALGVLLAIVGVRVLVSFLPPGFPRTAAIHVNGFVFAFTALVAVGAGFFFFLGCSLVGSLADPPQRMTRRGGGVVGEGAACALRAVVACVVCS